MSSLSVRLPDSLHNSLREISKKDHVSINQFVSSAVAEKITALETEKYLEKRAKDGSQKAFEAVLNKVRDIETDSVDK
jgi:predicted transcriptional regulator